MTRTIYICDKCKKEFDKRDSLTSIHIETEPFSSYPSRKKVFIYKDFCLECCAKLGIKFDNPKTEKEIEVQAKSLELRLFEIMQEVIETCSN
jgi:hypothetical protein